MSSRQILRFIKNGKNFSVDKNDLQIDVSTTIYLFMYTCYREDRQESIHFQLTNSSDLKRGIFQFYISYFWNILFRYMFLTKRKFLIINNRKCTNGIKYFITEVRNIWTPFHESTTAHCIH